MYLIADVPEGATALHFSILNTAEFDKVVLSNSDRIEDMEPEWVPNDEHLCAVVGSSVVGSKLRACITGGALRRDMTWADFHYYGVSSVVCSRLMPLCTRASRIFSTRSTVVVTARNNAARALTRTTVLRVVLASRGMTDTIGYEGSLLNQP